MTSVNGALSKSFETRTARLHSCRAAIEQRKADYNKHVESHYSKLLVASNSGDAAAITALNQEHQTKLQEFLKTIKHEGEIKKRAQNVGRFIATA